MRIKTTKQVRLDELIKYIDRNEEAKDKCFFPTPLRGGVTVTNSGQVKVEGVYLDDTFTIEVEEELTEDTEFEELWEVYYNKGRDDVDAYTDGKVNGVTSTSISRILEENLMDYENLTLAIFHRDILIWSKDTGIPTEGVIEV